MRQGWGSGAPRFQRALSIRARPEGSCASAARVKASSRRTLSQASSWGADSVVMRKVLWSVTGAGGHLECLPALFDTSLGVNRR